MLNNLLLSLVIWAFKNIINKVKNVIGIPWILLWSKRRFSFITKLCGKTFVHNFWFYIIIDQIEMLYQPVDKSKCGKTCDVNALCSCGTLAGTYQCACLPGYAGTGVIGNCFSKIPRLYLFIFCYKKLYKKTKFLLTKSML